MSNQNKSLAIVIPAYKNTFLAQTIESIANQTNKDFTLYVGDDASPYNLEDIVVRYKDRIDIVYKRFDTNVGGNDLVAQWTRCIELTQGEEWIWLFSDDDLMQPECVADFYKAQNSRPDSDIFRFNVNVIDRQGTIIDSCVAPKTNLSSKELYLLKQSGQMNSFVVEYVFSRRIYDNCGGFESFDLAWGSDLATWMKFGKRCGIDTVEGGRVMWRSSGENITTRMDDALSMRKIVSDMKFLKWSNCFIGTRRICMYNSNLVAKIIDNYTDRFSLRVFRQFVSLYSDSILIRALTVIMCVFYYPFFYFVKRMC